jgi:hypothetical protein
MLFINYNLFLLFSVYMKSQSQSILKSHPIPSRPATAPGAITLREWKPGIEWVTHFHNSQDGGYYHGRYFTDLGEAEADFSQRVKQELGTEMLSNSFEPIKVSERILEGIDAVRALATVNMFDARIVQAQAIALEYLETALWIEANPETYYDGMFREFTTLSN